MASSELSSTLWGTLGNVGRDFSEALFSPSMRLFRATKHLPPTEDDFKSAWDLGRRPPRPEDERKFRAVSTFTSWDSVVEKANIFSLGDYIAELEVPDEVERTVSRYHVSLHGTTPSQLLGYIVRTTPKPS
jgi:hypothetical protein